MLDLISYPCPLLSYSLVSTETLKTSINRSSYDPGNSPRPFCPSPLSNSHSSYSNQTYPTYTLSSFYRFVLIVTTPKDSDFVLVHSATYGSNLRRSVNPSLHSPEDPCLSPHCFSEWSFFLSNISMY